MWLNVTLIGLAVIFALKFLTFDFAFRVTEGFYETWYFFSDGYMKRMIKASELLSEKLQKISSEFTVIDDL